MKVSTPSFYFIEGDLLYGGNLVNCPTCGEPLEGNTVVCSICGVELHRDCAKKLRGDWYCKDCKKEAKKKSRYEKMSRRARSFGGKKTGWM